MNRVIREVLPTRERSQREGLMDAWIRIYRFALLETPVCNRQLQFTVRLDICSLELLQRIRVRRLSHDGQYRRDSQSQRIQRQCGTAQQAELYSAAED
jgi:hypothetical protein